MNQTRCKLMQTSMNKFWISLIEAGKESRNERENAYLNSIIAEKQSCAKGHSEILGSKKIHTKTRRVCICTFFRIWNLWSKQNLLEKAEGSQEWETRCNQVEKSVRCEDWGNNPEYDSRAESNDDQLEKKCSSIPVFRCLLSESRLVFGYHTTFQWLWKKRLHWKIKRRRNKWSENTKGGKIFNQHYTHENLSKHTEYIVFWSK